MKKFSLRNYITKNVMYIFNRPHSIYKYLNMALRLSDQDVNFLILYLSIPKRDLNTKKTSNIEVSLKSLRAMLEYCYIEQSLLYKLTFNFISKYNCNIPT